jgi:hypothetical protein
MLGRPTKYRPEYCLALVEHMRQGLSFEAFAGVIGVNQDTLHEWVKRHADFSEAKKVALEAGRVTLEKLGLALASGQVEGNTTAWIFLMKNRMGWRDRQEIEHTGKNGGPIETRHITEEELIRRTELLSERLKAISIK